MEGIIEAVLRSFAGNPLRTGLKGLVVLAVSAQLVLPALAATKFEQFITAAEAAYQRRDYPEAQKNFELALKESDKFEKNDKRVATTVYNLGLVFQAEGNYSEAEKNLNKAAELMSYLYGPENQRVAQVYMDLGDLYVEISGQGGANAESKTKAAENYRKGIDIFEKIYSQTQDTDAKPDEGAKDKEGKKSDSKEPKPRTAQETAADLANSLRVLADFYAEDEVYGQAEPLYKRSLELEEFAAGPDDKDLSKHKAKLAEMYCVQGKYKLAEPYFQSALTGAESSTGKDSIEVARICYNYGGLHYDQGAFGEAEILFKRALKIFANQADQDQQDLAQKTLALADVLDRQGKAGEAEDVYKKTLVTLEKGDKGALIRGLKMFQQHLLMQNKRDEAGKIAARIKDLKAQGKQQ